MVRAEHRSLYAESILQLESLLKQDDERVFSQTGITWDEYELILNSHIENSHLRFSYLEGTLTIVSPGRLHEITKEKIGDFVVAYLQEKGIEYIPLGSMTLKNKPKKAGKEPDKSYYIGTGEGEIPNLAIEVIVTSGNIEKNLETYARLGIEEVWFWQDNTFRLFSREMQEYREILSSRIIPNIDIELLKYHLSQPNFFNSLLSFKKKIRGEDTGDAVSSLDN